MILEGPSSGMFSDDQTLVLAVGAHNSTNVLALGDAYKGEGEPKDILIQITTAVDSAADGATLQVKLISDTEAAFGDSPQTDWDSGAIAEASLVAGYKFKIDKLPDGMQKYCKLTYTVAGENITAGAITAGLVGNVSDDPAKWPAANAY